VAGTKEECGQHHCDRIAPPRHGAVLPGRDGGSHAAQQEAAACLHWLESEIELVDPAALVALGATAARQLMGTTVSVLRERGRWLVRSDGRRVLIMLHPSALLRMDPDDKAAAYAAWLADLRHAADHFQAAPTSR
jgi:DNA polymerase